MNAVHTKYTSGNDQAKVNPNMLRMLRCATVAEAAAHARA